MLQRNDLRVCVALQGIKACNKHRAPPLHWRPKMLRPAGTWVVWGKSQQPYHSGLLGRYPSEVPMNRLTAELTTGFWETGRVSSATESAEPITKTPCRASWCDSQSEDSRALLQLQFRSTPQLAQKQTKKSFSKMKPPRSWATPKALPTRSYKTSNTDSSTAFHSFQMPWVHFTRRPRRTCVTCGHWHPRSLRGLSRSRTGSLMIWCPKTGETTKATLDSLENHCNSTSLKVAHPRLKGLWYKAHGPLGQPLSSES